MARTVFILNGPNLNLLGEREPEIYGRETLADIRAACESYAAERGLAVSFRQSNHEGDLVDWVHEARATGHALIINAGAYSHTSIALRDAVIAASLPVVEVHLSNLFKRDTFRQHSYLSDVSLGLICGFGSRGYILALEALGGVLSDGQGAS